MCRLDQDVELDENQTNKNQNVITTSSWNTLSLEMKLEKLAQDHTHAIEELEKKWKSLNQDVDAKIFRFRQLKGLIVECSRRDLARIDEEIVAQERKRKDYEMIRSRTIVKWKVDYENFCSKLIELNRAKLTKSKNTLSTSSAPISTLEQLRSLVCSSSTGAPLNPSSIVCQPSPPPSMLLCLEQQQRQQQLQCEEQQQGQNQVQEMDVPKVQSEVAIKASPSELDLNVASNRYYHHQAHDDLGSKNNLNAFSSWGRQSVQPSSIDYEVRANNDANENIDLNMNNCNWLPKHLTTLPTNTTCQGNNQAASPLFSSTLRDNVNNNKRSRSKKFNDDASKTSSNSSSADHETKKESSTSITSSSLSTTTTTLSKTNGTASYQQSSVHRKSTFDAIQSASSKNCGVRVLGSITKEIPSNKIEPKAHQLDSETRPTYFIPSRPPTSSSSAPPQTLSPTRPHLTPDITTTTTTADLNRSKALLPPKFKKQRTIDLKGDAEGDK